MKSNFLLGGLIVLFSFSVVNAKEKETPQNWSDRTVLPIEPYQKVGKIAPVIKDSDKIDWPKEISAPEGAPNLLLIMIDDVGFGGTFAFGDPYSYSKCRCFSHKRNKVKSFSYHSSLLAVKSGTYNG